jgi:exodeoxyribonuclease VII small subunit
MSKSTRKPAPKSADATLDPEIAALGFEEAVEELQTIIEQMEQGKTGLEDSLKDYARGDQIIRRCRQILDAAEARIEAISGGDLDSGEEPESTPI